MKDPIQRLILELSRLPGVGERSAARLAYYIIRTSQGERSLNLAQDLSAALREAAESVRLCSICQNLTGQEICSICADPKRDTQTLCVVENVADLRALESSSAYQGRYHVLHGSLSPLEGVGPAELKIDELLQRVQGGAVTEVILGTSADVEGDATALYLAKLLRPFQLRVTRLASGIPLGGELEFIDQGTLGRALAERREF